MLAALTERTPHVAATTEGPDGLSPPGTPEEVIWRFNQEHVANDELYERGRHSTDLANQAARNENEAKARAKQERDGWRTSQLEHPHRRAWLPWMVLIAVVLLGLDAWAAYFAAEALGNDQRSTLLWAGLFLVILGLLEAGLAWSAERSRRVFSLIALALAVFVILLALLRFGFFSTIGTGLLAAVVAAAVFTACTIIFVIGGFAAIRYAETLTIWQARRHARKAERQAADAAAAARRRAADRDRLVNAYIGRIRPTLLRQLGNARDMEDKVRAHMLGSS
jgi:energy-converting hydrogenase Eha subunit C